MRADESLESGDPNGLFKAESYAKFLDTAISLGYSFLSFDEMPGERNTIHLRHDIDNSISSALHMAEMEAKMGVRSTYLPMLRSRNYNPLTYENRLILRMIRDLGHWIGLHFVIDKSMRLEDLEKLVRADSALLSEQVEAPVTCFSFHNPEIMGTLDLGVPGMTGAYDRAFFKDIRYISDSNMRWREGPPEEVLKREVGQSFQILVHPFSYVGNLKTPQDVLLEFLLQKNRELIEENTQGVVAFEGHPVVLADVARHLLHESETEGEGSGSL